MPTSRTRITCYTDICLAFPSVRSADRRRLPWVSRSEVAAFGGSCTVPWIGLARPRSWSTRSSQRRCHSSPNRRCEKRKLAATCRGCPTGRSRSGDRGGSCTSSAGGHWPAMKRLSSSGVAYARFQRLAREHPSEVSLCVSHADPIQAAWVLFEGRPQTEREMYRKSVHRAAMLELDMDADRVASIRYVPSPKVPHGATVG